MRLQHQWGSGLVAAVLGGLMSVTVVAAGGEQFLPVLGMREGGQRFVGIPLNDGYIAYLTLLNERDGGIHGVKLVWEECETVYDVARGVECYERLKAKGPTGATVFHPMGTAPTYALTERAAPDRAPPGHDGLWACGRHRWAGVSVCLQPPEQLVESEHGEGPVHRPTRRWHGAAQGRENRPCLLRQ